VTAPVVIGPKGWAAQTTFFQVAEWTARYLVQPDGPRAGDPWQFTDQQAQILSWWYAFDERGRWLFRRGTVRMMKGWGKDPLGAVLALVELCGPSRVNPRTLRAERYAAPWVDVAAVSREQTKTTMRLIPQLLPKHTIERYGIDVNKGIVYADGGRGTLQAVTSSPDSLEGSRSTLSIRNEVQFWYKTNEGHAMAQAIDGNLAKSRDGAARALSLCNAHVPGEDSVGEREWDAYRALQDGKIRRRDVLYVAVEAPADTDLRDEASLTAGIIAARGDSVWLDPERLVAEVWDPQTPPSESRRKYLNQVVAAEDAWIAPHEFKACADPKLVLEGKTMVTLGFDGSKTEDHTGLIATRVEDGAAFVLGHWDPATTQGEVPREEIDAAVAAAFESYDVVAFYADEHPWESYIDRWTDEFGVIDRKSGLCIGANARKPIAWDMRARGREFTHAAERFHEAVIDKVFKYDGDLRLEAHALNARRRINRNGTGFGKETRESLRKVDLLAAAVLSRLAWYDYQTLPKSKQRRVAQGTAAFY
jgi:phage terminase large subunit-like protein